MKKKYRNGDETYTRCYHSSPSNNYNILANVLRTEVWFNLKVYMNLSRYIKFRYIKSGTHDKLYDMRINHLLIEYLQRWQICSSRAGWNWVVHHGWGSSIAPISLRRSSENYISPSGKYRPPGKLYFSDPSYLLRLIFAILVQMYKGSYWKSRNYEQHCSPYLLNILEKIYKEHALEQKQL